MKLLMVRHGEIPSNVRKIYAGTSPEVLTEKGLSQARDVAERLQTYNVDTLYSSPIQRAIQTTEIISKAINKEYSIDDSFRELEMGPWEGQSESDIPLTFPEEWNIWQTRPAELKLSGRETLKELQARVLNGIKDIYKHDYDKKIVIVTHVAIIRVLQLWDSNQTLNLYKTIHVPNADIFELEINDSAYFAPKI